jgi:SulP family sulfate permease
MPNPEKNLAVNTPPTGVPPAGTEPADAAGLAGDLWGGLAAMLVALPSAIAFGVVVATAIDPGMAAEGARMGIFGAAAMGIVAPLVGRNGGFISAPCAPAAAVLSALAVTLGARGDQDAGRIAGLLGLTALLSALLQIGYGAARAGRLIKYMPYQVVTGYLSGVAVIIALGQLPKLLGLPPKVTLAAGLLAPRTWSGTGLVVGTVTIGVMALAPRFTRRIPAAILGLFAGIAAYFVLAAGNQALLRMAGNPLVIGPIETAGSLVGAVRDRAAAMFQVKAADVSLIFVSALTLSLLLSIDTLKTGVVLDALTRRRHDSNRELFGQGAANAVAFMVGGMPGSGAMGPTLVNFSSGGRTPRAGVAEGLLVVAVYALFSRLIAWVPLAALAGVLLMVAWRMFDRSMFRLLRHPSTRVDFAVIATVVVVAQFGLIAASAAGICLAILLYVRNQIRGSVILSNLDLRTVHSKRRRLKAETDLLAQYGGKAGVVQLQGDLFFGTTDQLFTEIEDRLATMRFVLIDLRKVHSMDFTAAHLFEQMRTRLDESGGDLLFCGMPSNLPERADIDVYLRQFGLATSGRGILVFANRDNALEWMEDRILEEAGWKAPEEGAPLGVGEMEIFKPLSPATLAGLAGMVRTMAVPAGGRIFSAGDPGDELFLVRRGVVHALLPLPGGSRHHIATLCRGDYFGEMAFLDHRQRSADVEAATAVELYALSRERFDALARLNPELGGQVFEQLALALSNRLRMADSELSELEAR